MTGGNSIQENNDVCVNDVDVYARALENGPMEAENVMVYLASRAQKWVNLLDVIAQSTAFHKCTVQILAHDKMKPLLRIDYEYCHEMDLIDSKGEKGPGLSIPLLGSNK